MNNGELRFAFVSSSAGSVMNEVLKNEFVRSRVHLVAVDHIGDAFEKARRFDILTMVVAERQAERFSDEILKLLREHEIDVVFSFYTQFYSSALRDAFRDRIVNFHPSLLPAFKGHDGFGDTVAYPARFAGNTVELISDVMDEGKIIMQTVCPVDVTMPVERTRHQVFVQQCQALIQVTHWFQEGRLTVDGHRVEVEGARFDSRCFSPALDSEDAMNWVPPDPYAG